MNFIKKLFHKHRFSILLGHREKSEGIILVTKCKCGVINEVLYADDDPYIDEDSPKFGTVLFQREGNWSGYTWYLHKGLADDADLTQIKTRKV